MLGRVAIGVCVGVLVGCATGPHNGATADGNVIGKTFLFQGFTDHPNEQVVLEVLKQPSAVLSDDSNWVQFATATTETSPVYVNSTVPLYYWSVTAAPVPTFFQIGRWPMGGLVRTRARRVDAQGESRVLTTFDEVSFSDCFSKHFSAGDDWLVIGSSCGSPIGGITAIASTQKSPLDLPPAEKPDWLGRKGDISPAETDAYYATWGAPPTLTAFKAKYGFPFSFPFIEVTATYYNDGDLGLGREMHCKKFGYLSSTDVACYVMNYSGVAKKAAFGVDPAIVLGDAVNRAHPFATVAMVYEPMVGGSNSVRFVAYDENEILSNIAQLDSVGAHKSVPNNCLNCHGISSVYNASSHTVSGSAKFLPFDPFSFKYSTAPGFTYDDQQDAIRRLNAMVKETNPTPAIAQWIDRMYAPKAVTDPTAVAQDTYVPDEWENVGTAGITLYEGVIKRGCRTCHASATAANLDFLESADWSPPLLPTIRQDVCGRTSGTAKGHPMPHAEHVSKKFWASGGRAYLMTHNAVNPPDGLEGCSP